MLDRIGTYLGEIRRHEKLTLKQLTEGLCTPAQLMRIESGEREADKLLTATLMQRLGKSIGQFDVLLGLDEYHQWMRRKNILNKLIHREFIRGEQEIKEYEDITLGILHKQFAKIALLNMNHIQQMSKHILYEDALRTLRMTQPKYEIEPLNRLYLSRNECWLVLRMIELKESMTGSRQIITEYRALMYYMQQSRYVTSEQVHVLPYVIWHVAKYEYDHGHFAEVVALCNSIIKKLNEACKLFGYNNILELKKKALDAQGLDSTETAFMLIELKHILNSHVHHNTLWIPYDEESNVYMCNRVIRERRVMLGMTQEMFMDSLEGARGNVVTLSRIENEKHSLHKENRRRLLQGVHLSGERYEYEIITDKYDDYIIRSQLGKFIFDHDFERANKLLCDLKNRIPEIETNLQYCELIESIIMVNTGNLTIESWIVRLKNILCRTIPSFWETGRGGSMLSINEIAIIHNLAICFQKQKEYDNSLHLLYYLKKCMEGVSSLVPNNIEIYLSCMTTLSSVLGDCGRFEESDRIAYDCIELSMVKSEGIELASQFYTLAWNLEQQFGQFSEKELDEKKNKCLHMLKQAFGIILLLDNPALKQLIIKHCTEIYNIDAESYFLTAVPELSE